MSNKSTTGEEILAAMRDLRERGRHATRQVLAQMLDVKLTIIDDHIKRMKDDGKIVSPVNGVFELVEPRPPDRAVSVTFLPDGMVKIEIGDIVLPISMREAQMLSMGVGGVFLQFAKVR